MRARITWGLAGVLLACAGAIPARDRAVEGCAAVAASSAEGLAIVSPVSGEAQIVLISRDGSMLPVVSWRPR